MDVCWPLKIAVRGYSQAEAASLSVFERRRRITHRIGYIARCSYIGVQLLCLAILLQSDSDLGHSWRGTQALYAWSFLALLLLNFMLYIALCMSSPGYLPVPDADEEKSVLISHLNTQPPQPDGASALHVSSKVRPLPYPTDHANYINLAALGRELSDEPEAAVPWWDLPNPGQRCIIRQQMNMLTQSCHFLKAVAL